MYVCAYACVRALSLSFSLSLSLSLCMCVCVCVCAFEVLLSTYLTTFASFASAQVALSRHDVDGLPVFSQELWMQPVTSAQTDIVINDGSSADDGVTSGDSANARGAGTAGGDADGTAGGGEVAVGWETALAASFADDYRFAQQQCTFLLAWSLCESYNGMDGENIVSLSSITLGGKQ